MPLPEPVPDLGALDLLVTVGEVGSISAAAEAHGVTQPAASMRLRQLERVLGLQLLERVRTGSRLTPAGAATAEWAGAVLREMRALLGGADALRSDQRSHLRLAASLTVAEYLIPGWLRQLAGELVIVVGRGHPWGRRRRPVTPADLAATPLIVREHGSGTRDVLAAALAEHGLELRTSMELGSTTAIKAAAVGGGSPAVLSALSVDAELRSGQLQHVACPGLRLERTIRAIWAGGRT